MKVSTGQLARRYATALFESAVDAGKIDILAKEAAALIAVVSPQLEHFFASPTRSVDEKEKITRELIEQLKLSELTSRTLSLMGQNNRLSHVKLVFKKVLALADEHKRIVRAKVKVAQTLSSVEIAELEKVLSQTTGQSVVVECETEPQLRAGMIVNIGTRQIDSSLKTRMSNLKEFLSQGV